MGFGFGLLFWFSVCLFWFGDGECSIFDLGTELGFFDCDLVDRIWGKSGVTHDGVHEAREGEEGSGDWRPETGGGRGEVIFDF